MPVPSTPQDLITLIREKLYDNTSGIIEEDTLRNVLENIINILDAKFSFFSPTLTEEQYAQWNLMLDFMLRETKGVLTISSTAPTGTTAKGKYLLSDIGTYTNLGGIVTTAGKLNYAYFDGTTWKLIAVDITLNIIDGLTSTSTTSAGSANNDRQLKSLIDSTNAELISNEEVLTEMLTTPPTSMGTFETKYLAINEPFVAGKSYRVSIKLLTQINDNSRTGFTVHLEPAGGGSPYQILFADHWINVGDTYVFDFTAAYNSERVMFYCTNFGGNIETSIKKVEIKEVGVLPDIEFLKSQNQEKTNIISSIKNPLTNKKIVWFGTSIPAGVSSNVTVNGYTGANKYPSMVGYLTGATVYNEAIGGSRISTGWASDYNATTNLLGLRNQQDNAFQVYSALGHTIAEKDYLFDNWATLRSYFNDNANLSDTPPLTKEQFRDYSFERKLIKKYLTDTATIGRGDLYVIDHSFNDFTKILESIAMPTFYSATERMQYWGAMNYFIRKIYADNPHHRIIMISHYRNNGEEYLKKIYEIQKLISKFWGIPLIDIAEKMQIGEQFITTNGYWDASGFWHKSGYTFTDNTTSYTTNDTANSSKSYTDYKNTHNPRQVQANTELATIYAVGTWVYDIHPQTALMKDNLHPHSDMSGEMNMKIAKFISDELVKYI